jgi:hypothetical protein
VGRYTDAATRIEAEADFIEKQMPEVAKAIRQATEILRGCDKYCK